jgi:hypothetical protein
MKKSALACVLLFAVAALSQSQTITVTSPNGGENWVLGSPHNITWRSSGVTGKVNILLFNRNQRVGVIQSDVAVSAGSFSWIVGNYQGGTAAPGTNYKVEIRKPQTEILDASDRPFTISGAPAPASITVTSPNGGETWYTNAVHEVRWTSSGISGSVTISLKKGGAVIRSWTAENTGSSYGSYSWAQAGTDYRIRVEDSADPAVFDESDQNFTIQVPPGPTPPPPGTGGQAPPSRIPGITSFKINNDAQSTFSTTVILNNSVLLEKADEYRADERNDFSNRPDWLPYNSAPKYTFIDQGEGEKKVYFQVKYGFAFSGVVSDTIRYTVPRAMQDAVTRDIPGPVRLTADPKITSAAIRIIRTWAQEEAYDKKYTIELAYDFEVEDVPNADKLSIDVLAIPKSGLIPSGGGDWPPEASQHHRYSEGTRSGTAIRISGRMTIVHNGLYALVGSSPGLLWLSELIKFAINIPPDYGYRDSNTDNNQVTKEIQFSVGSAKKSKTCCDCALPLGIDGQDWNFSLRDLVPQYAWIAGSILRLNQCGDTGWTGTELKCDRLSLVAGQGERLVRFTRRPDRASLMGTVYYRCEGLGNWYNLGEATATQGEQECPGAQFWWEVETYFIEPTVVN